MIAAKVATVDLVVELNLPLSTLVRINKVFKKSLRIQTLLKGQLKMFLFLVLSSSFLCLLFFFFVLRGRHVCPWLLFMLSSHLISYVEPFFKSIQHLFSFAFIC